MSLFHHLFLPHHTNNQRAKVLHPSGVSVIIGVFALFQILIGQISSHYPQILGYASQIAPEEIVRLTNVKRQAQGLQPVKLNSTLSQAAAKKAADMFARDYWAHVSPTGTQPWFFISEAGYAYRYAGENLARDFSDPVSIVEAWMNSSSHRDNLLSSKYQEIGVAVVDGTLQGRDTTLVVQMFGTQLSVSPVVSGTAVSINAKAKEEVPAQQVSPVPVATPVPAAADVPRGGGFITSTQEPVKQSWISPYELTKYVSFWLLILFGVVLVADVIIVKRKKIIRWTGKSLAHLIFIVILIIAATTVLRGQII